MHTDLQGQEGGEGGRTEGAGKKAGEETDWSPGRGEEGRGSSIRCHCATCRPINASGRAPSPSIPEPSQPSRALPPAPPALDIQTGR